MYSELDRVLLTLFLGYVTHGGDGFLWHLRVPQLNPDQVEIAKSWLKRVDEEVKELEKTGSSARSVKDILRLGTDRGISWSVDHLWDEKMRRVEILGGRVRLINQSFHLQSLLNVVSFLYTTVPPDPRSLGSPSA